MTPDHTEITKTEFELLDRIERLECPPGRDQDFGSDPVTKDLRTAYLLGFADAKIAAKSVITVRKD